MLFIPLFRKPDFCMKRVREKKKVPRNKQAPLGRKGRDKIALPCSGIQQLTSFRFVGWLDA